MKTFRCGNCHNPLYFENDRCENCGHLSGYRSSDRRMLAFDPSKPTLVADGGKVYKYCQNKEYHVCNWVIDADSRDKYCKACQLNRTIPNLSNEKNFRKWKNLEVAKHRLVYQLQKIGLEVKSKLYHKDGLCFDFIAKEKNSTVMTGHANGVVTILVSEADSVSREKMRKQLQEPYRTIIGHLRHEVGHYFWERLILNNREHLLAFRRLFGNEESN